jgi:hypothetical protein
MTNNKNILKAINLLQAVLLQNDEKDELQLEIQEFIKSKPFMIEMTEDEFYNEFNCVKNHLNDNASFDGYMFETYGEELQHIQGLCKNDVMKQTVWTIIEAEGKLFYISGFHYVNRFGYLITEEPIEEGLEIEVAINTEVDMQEAKLFKEIEVIDPDTKGEVQLAVFKHQNGGIFAIDSSYIEQEFEDDNDPNIPDPFSKDNMNWVVLKET